LERGAKKKQTGGPRTPPVWPKRTNVYLSSTRVVVGGSKGVREGIQRWPTGVGRENQNSKSQLKETTSQGIKTLMLKDPCFRPDLEKKRERRRGGGVNIGTEGL